MIATDLGAFGERHGAEQQATEGAGWQERANDILSCQAGQQPPQQLALICIILPHAAQPGLPDLARRGRGQQQLAAHLSDRTANDLQSKAILPH